MGRLVAIVGRPNVGKSTLFNRLTQTRAAIVNDTSGTTRDRQYGKMEWNGMEMSVVDTGGWVVNSEDIFEEEINKQVQLAIDEADVILFVVDIKNGITDLDDHVADILRRTSKPVIVVANKDDNNQSMYAEAEFYALGLGEPYSISAINGTGTGDLLDQVVKVMPSKAEEALDEELPRFAIVGRPNAGKSSLVNSLMDEQRNIVTDIAGTTRDSIYSRYNKFGFNFYLVDTAGIRKKNKVNEDIEYYSVLRSIRAIENSDVCILLIDATRGIEAQDVNIFSIIQKNRKGLVVLVNKWDVAEDMSPRTRPSSPSPTSRPPSASASPPSPTSPSSLARRSPSSASTRCCRQPLTSTTTAVSPSPPPSSTTCCKPTSRPTRPPLSRASMSRSSTSPC